MGRMTSKKKDVHEEWVTLPCKGAEIVILHYIYKKTANDEKKLVSMREIKENTKLNFSNSRFSQILIHLEDIKLVEATGVPVYNGNFFMKQYRITPAGKEYFEEFLQFFKKCGKIVEKYNLEKS